MSPLNLLLISVCVVQFGIIWYILLARHEPAISNQTVDKVAIAAVSKIAHETPPLSKDVGKPEKKLDGVAATLMLHTPLWFQRRYTMMVFNILNNLPPNWKVQIFYTGEGQSVKGIEVNRGLKRLIENHKDVILTVIPPEILKFKKRQQLLLTDPWIWKNMLADKVLLFGGNQVICSNSPYNINTFSGWDYIGTPWDYRYKGKYTYDKGIGGDGGISIRNRTLMLEVIQYELDKHDTLEEKNNAYTKWGQEDYFFVSRMLEMVDKGLIHPKIAARNDTLQFGAIGGVYNENNLVASGILPKLKDEERDKFLSLCPELKILYPSLHNPNCFGAHPQKEACALSICALRAEHKGGC